LVKLYIKYGGLIIREEDVTSDPHYYYWDGKDGSGSYVEPGEYTLEIEATKGGVKHSDTHDFTVFKLDRVCLSSEYAIESPVCWDGGDILIGGSPCDPDATEPSLIIPYSNVATVYDVVTSYEIDAEAFFEPEISLFYFPLGIQYENKWSKISGHNSGFFLDRIDLHVQYLGPIVGGISELEFEVPQWENTRTKLFLHLPLAGADMTSWLENELKSIPAWAQFHKYAVEDYYSSWNPARNIMDRFRHFYILSGEYFDYALDPVSADEKSPCDIYRQDVSTNGDYTYVTVNGVVVHGAKINNIMWAVFARAWGWSPGWVEYGSNRNNQEAHGVPDSAAAAYSVSLGARAIYNWVIEGEGPLTDVLVLSTYDLFQMREPPETDSILHILWPSPDPLDPGKSTMVRGGIPIPIPE